MVNLLNLCFFASKNLEKCTDLFINLEKITDIFLLKINFSLFLFAFLIFFFHLIITKKILNINFDSILFTNTIFISLFYLTIYIFDTNLISVDDYSFIDGYVLDELPFLNWLFQFENIHNHSLLKLIIFLNLKLNFSFETFNYYSVFLIFICSLFFLKLFQKLNIHKNIVILSLILLYSGKLFPSVSQLVNISWTLNFFFITIFIYNIYKAKNYSHNINYLVLILAPNIFGSGFAIVGYSLIYGFINLKEKIGYKYIFFAIFSIIFAFAFPKLFVTWHHQWETKTFDIYNIFKILYFPGFFSNVFFPWSTVFSIPMLIIGYIQISLIIYFSLKKNISINSFITNNIILLISIILACFVAFARPEIERFIQPRYVTISILFQIGFLIFFNEEIKKFLKRKILNKIFFFISSYILIIGLCTPYLGIHWQANKSVVNYEIEKCFTGDKDEKVCLDFAYEKLFYGGDWYPKLKFVRMFEAIYFENGLKK